MTTLTLARTFPDPPNDFWFSCLFTSLVGPSVFDDDGDAWSFHGILKLKLDRDGNFEVVKESIALTKRGN